ncbi:MAG TPA: L-threonylcarbamoyladenylate synthase [Chloroflexota bacterium]
MSLISPGAGVPRVLDGSDPVAIVEAGRLLRLGQVVVIPTDTGYGIAAGLFHPTAVDRVYDIKQRDTALRLPLLIATAADLPLVASDIPDTAWRLINKFWPGPMSLVLPATAAVPRSVTDGRGTVAIRVPNGRACLQLLEFMGEPVTGTSANLSGRPGALTASDAVDQVGAVVDAILVDDSAVVQNKASTVVELQGGTLTIHREGALSADLLRGAAAPRMAAGMQLISSRNRR